MAISKPSLGGTYYYSMAYVIMGGLLISTVLTTIFLPATIAVIEDTPAWIKRVLGKFVDRLSWPVKRIQKSA